MLQPSATRELNTTSGAPLKAATVAASAAASLLPTSGVISGGAQVLTGLKGDTVSLPYVDNVTGGGQWHQDESPFAEARMRDDQIRTGEHGLAQQNQIEIQRPRGVTARPRAAASQFQRQQPLQQRGR